MSALHKEPNESNDAYCRRIASIQSSEAIVCDLLVYIAKKDPSRPMWSHIGMATSHGSGVSKAIQDRFLPDWEDYKDKKR